MAYGKLRRAFVKGLLGTTWVVEVWQKDYTGTSTVMDLQGEGFEIKWSGKSEVGKRLFLPSECVLNFIVENDTDEDWIKDDFFAKGPKYHFIRIYKNSTAPTDLFWFGWMEASFSSVENISYPYIAKLTATDSYGYYSKLKESEFTSYTQKEETHSIYDLQRDFLEHFDVDDLAPSASYDSIRNALDWYDENTTYASADPFVEYGISKGAVADRDKLNENGEVVVKGQDRAFIYKESDVLDDSLNAFGAVGYLSDGKYWFVQPHIYRGSTDGVIRVYDHNNSASTSSSNENTLLTIDGTNNHLLGGASFNYEPPLSNVSLVYEKANTSLNVNADQSLTTEFNVGVIYTGQSDNYVLDFSAIYKEDFQSSEISLNPSDYDIRPSSFGNDGSSISNITLLTIKVTDGTTTKYLKINNNNFDNLEWTTTASTVALVRGYIPLDIFLTGPMQSVNGFLPNSADLDLVYVQYPFPPSGGIFDRYKTTTQLKFIAEFPDPEITGVITMSATTSNNYYQAKLENTAPDASTIFLPLTNPTTFTKQELTSANIEITPVDSDSQFTSGSVVFNLSQDTVPSNESLDLDSINVGTNLLSNLYSIKKQNSNNDWIPAEAFQSGNPVTPDYKNISTLRCEEVINLRTEPLEIIQGDIYSTEISPSKYIKYALNGDSDYSYYLFNGGTLKPMSEKITGEWYKVGDVNYNLSEEEIPGTQEAKLIPSPDLTTKNVKSNFALNGLNSFGTTANGIATNTATTSITLSENTKGLIKNGQKLLICKPDGTGKREITCSSELATGNKVLSVTSFTTYVDYPVGSFILPLMYDFTNVISGGGTPGGSNTQVQFNDSGAFGGDSVFTYNDTTNTLTVPNLAVEDVDITGVANALTVDCGSGNVGIYVISSLDDIATIRYGDPNTDDVVIAGADGDDFFIRTDDGGFKIKTQENATVALEVTAAGELKTHNIGNIFDTEAYLTPVDFTISDNTSYPVYSRTNGGDSEVNNSNVSAFATFQVPLGYEATHVAVYGSSTSSTFDVYSCTVTTGTASSLTSSPSVGSNQSLSTAQSGVTGKYLTIKYSPGATGRKVYGAKITLART